jgi:multiple sugar transport system ATP-binding protein
VADLELKELRKSFGAVQVVKGVDLRVEDGEFVVFVGPSGCGKSTLLRMIAGLEKITEGELWIDGKLSNDIPPQARGLAMVFQSYALYPHMTVYDNIGYNLKLAKLPREERDRAIRDAAELLQITPFLDRRPGQLSGGQRQRVAIGRAIVRNPGIFLFDEPLSNLDASLRMEMRLELAKLHTRLGTTMIYVTHDQVEAMTLADRIVALKDGVVQQIGAPLDLYDRPANLFVAGFIGAPRMNFFEAVVRSASATQLVLTTQGERDIVLAAGASGLAPGDKVTLGVRPHACTLDSEGPWAGTVTVIEELGYEAQASVETGGNAAVTMILPSSSGVAVGAPVRFTFTPGKLHLFDSTGTRVALEG